MSEDKMNANYAKDLLLEIAKEFNCDAIYLYANLLSIKKQNSKLREALEDTKEIAKTLYITGSYFKPLSNYYKEIIDIADNVL